MSTTIQNPIIWSDIPDLDIIRYGEYFYTVSTTMHMTPGCPIMRSKDLLNWEIVNYVYTTYANEPKHNLQNNENIYGKGSWAACIREHKGRFYVCFSSNDVANFYIYSTTNLEEGTWECSIIPELFHDPTLLFINNRVFVIYGNGDIYIKELSEDVTQLKPDGLQQLLLKGETKGIGLRIEGCHAYYINGFYYLFFIEWPNEGLARRRQVCYRSKHLLGPYEHKVILEDDLDYYNKGVAQGGIVEASNGAWYSLLFQDHDAVGRIPVLVPMKWVDYWPVLGMDGKVPVKFEVDLPFTPTRPIVVSDEFDYRENKLALQWQWNHNPNVHKWSVTNKKGYLQLTIDEQTDTVLQARNTLTQRTEGPLCEIETRLNYSQLKAGDHAGLVALQSHFGTVSVIIDEQSKPSVNMTVNDGFGKEQILEQVDIIGEEIELKIRFEYRNSIDLAYFYFRYSEREQWIQIGQPLKMKYTLDHFMGYRFGLFAYGTKRSGGIAAFDYARYYKEVNGKLIKVI